MNFANFNQPIQRVLERVLAALPEGIPVYLVGGAVRDMLLNRPIQDLDFILPEAAIRLGRRVASKLGADFYPLDKARDTGRAILNEAPFGRLRLDFAGLRGPDLESDQRDRDFTINAIGLDLRHPERLADPLGGARDLLKKVIRPCAPDSFSNDPVRILRAVRQSIQFGFKILPESARLIHTALPRLAGVSPERLRDELFRMLDGPRPASAFRMLDIFEAIPFILPELNDLKGVEQPPPHNQDVWEHSLTALQKLDEALRLLGPEHDPEVASNWTHGLISLRLGRYRLQLQEHLSARLNPDRSPASLLYLAALYHDAGKPLTARRNAESKIVFYGHDLEGERLARRRGAILRLSNQEIDRLGKIVRHHMRPLLLANAHNQPTNRAIYRFFRETEAAGVDICLLSLADVQATYGPALPQETWVRQLDIVRTLLEAWWEHPQERISPPALLNGDDLMNHFALEPGPMIGELLNALREAQATGEINRREEALAFLRARLDQG